MVLASPLLNTQHYKVWIKGKVEQSRERSSSVVAAEKEAFRSPATTVARDYGRPLNFIYTISILLLVRFSHHLMVFPSSLSDSKFQLVSRNFLSIQLDLNNAVESFNLFSEPLGIVPSAPTVIGIGVTFMFYSFFFFFFFGYYARFKYLSVFKLSFSFTL